MSAGKSPRNSLQRWNDLVGSHTTKEPSITLKGPATTMPGNVHLCAQTATTILLRGGMAISCPFCSRKRGMKT